MSPSAVSTRIAETEQLHQAQRMIGGIGNVLLSRPILKLKMGKIHWFLWWTSGAKKTLLPPRVYVQNVSVCTFKTSPCVPAPRAHVSTHVRVVRAYTGTF